MQSKRKLCDGISIFRLFFALPDIFQILPDLLFGNGSSGSLHCLSRLEFCDELLQTGNLFLPCLLAFQNLIQLRGLDLIGARSLFITAVHQLFRLIHQCRIRLGGKHSE